LKWTPKSVAKTLTRRPPVTAPTLYFPVYVGPEAVDPNLSIVDMGVVEESTATSEIRFVPKNANITGLETGMTLICLGPPFVIIGILQGDTTLAEI